MIEQTVTPWPGGSSAGRAAGVVEYRRLTFRALVLQAMRTELPAVWESTTEDGDDLVAMAAACGCAGPVRRRCAHRRVCLAVAVWLDDPAEWVAGYPRHARVELFDELAAMALIVEPWIGRGTRTGQHR